MRWGLAKAAPKAKLRPAASEVCNEQKPKDLSQLQNQLNFGPSFLHFFATVNQRRFLTRKEARSDSRAYLLRSHILHEAA